MTYPYELRKISLRMKRKYKINEIADILQINRSTLYKWSKKENIKPLRQRTSKITPVIKCYIRSYIIKRITFRYTFLIEIIKKRYNISISKSYLYEIVKKLNISRKKIYYRYVNKKNRYKAMKKFKNKIKKTDLKDIISIDETSIDTHLNSGYGWSLKGKKITVKHKIKRIRYTVICAIDNSKIIHVKIIKNSANGEIFKDFLTEVMEKFKKNDSKKYLLMDNARIHHYGKLKDYMLNKKKAFDIIYNVPYSPEYNPIEYVFNEAKLNLKQDKTKKSIKDKIRKAFKKVKSANINKYFQKSLKF